MKKYVIIGLVLAALALGSCGGQKGGTIVIKNEYKLAGSAALATVTITSVIPPVFKVETIPAGETKEITLEEDGTYKLEAVPATVSPSSVTLKGNNTVTVTVK